MQIICTVVYLLAHAQHPKTPYNSLPEEVGFGLHRNPHILTGLQVCQGRHGYLFNVGFFCAEWKDDLSARRSLAQRLQNPGLLRITFHTLRHFKGTMEYHKTKDILHVMQVLGHKNIKNTLMYVQLADELFRDQQEYTSKVAKTETDACALIEAGFEYICDFEKTKLFRKRKY
jgi:hypothetical protein